MRRWAALVLILSAAAGCGGSLKEQRREGVANFEAAKAHYDRGDYLDAIPDFKAYVEQYPGTDRTDDALYYLGESYLREKDYALASAQFDRLLRDFPSSPLQADALFELARCDDLQSHPAPLDQAETERALTRYNQFVDQYPSHSRVAEARARIQALRDRLAEKILRSARLYAKLRQETAATIYSRRVLALYPDSKWAPEAALLLAGSLERQGRKQEAVETLKKFIPSAPDGEIKRKADERLRGLQASEAPR